VIMAPMPQPPDYTLPGMAPPAPSRSHDTCNPCSICLEPLSGHSENKAELPDTLERLTACQRLKVGTRRLDLSKRTDKVMGCAYGSRGYVPEATLEGVCAAAREPPLLPDEVTRLLETEKKFTAGADIEVVDKLYRSFFDGASRFAQRLTFSGLQWGDAEARQLANVLSHFGALTTLDLSKNRVGAEGGKMIAAYVKVNAVLTNLNLASNFWIADELCIPSVQSSGW